MEEVGKESSWSVLLRICLYVAAVFQIAAIAAVFVWPSHSDGEEESWAGSPESRPQSESRQHLGGGGKQRTKQRETRKRR